MVSQLQLCDRLRGVEFWPCAAFATLERSVCQKVQKIEVQSAASCLRCRTTCCDARVKRNMSDGRRNGSSWSWRISRKGTRGTRAPLVALAMRLIAFAPRTWHVAPEPLWCLHVKCSDLWAVLRQQLTWPKQIHTPLSDLFLWNLNDPSLLPTSHLKVQHANRKKKLQTIETMNIQI